MLLVPLRNIRTFLEIATQFFEVHDIDMNRAIHRKSRKVMRTGTVYFAESDSTRHLSTHEIYLSRTSRSGAFGAPVDSTRCSSGARWLKNRSSAGTTPNRLRERSRLLRFMRMRRARVNFQLRDKST